MLLHLRFYLGKKIGEVVKHDEAWEEQRENRRKEVSTQTAAAEGTDSVCMWVCLCGCVCVKGSTDINPPVFVAFHCLAV